MKKPDNDKDSELRKKIIGLGELSGRKSYFPELKAKISELEREIEERIEVENELKRTRAYIHDIINSMPSILVGIDKDRNITQWNLEAETYTRLNVDQVFGQPLQKVLPLSEVEQELIQNALDSRQVQTARSIESSSESERRFHDITVYPLTDSSDQGVVIRIDDVTERTRLEQVMIQSEKMVSLGELAAGMAHEINNPLGSILQGIQNVKRRLSPGLKKNLPIAEKHGINLEKLQVYMQEREIPNILDTVQDAGKRAAEIILSMLKFSRKSESEKSHVSLEALLENALMIASQDYDLVKKYDFKHINIVRDFDPALNSLYCAKTEIEQVILNLLKNAAHAINDDASESSPQITIRTRKKGRVAILEIEDNGAGMLETTKKRIFEPFYTTKPVGKGTGLGLAVSYMIITNNHQGTIEAESKPGKGTIFKIRLPLVHNES